MNEPTPIVLKLQQDALDSNSSVTNLLRAAKVIATKLDQTDALLWINRELDGYLDLQVEDLPAYRLLTGQWKAKNPYHGWQTINFENSETAKSVSQAPIGAPIGSIERDLMEKGKLSLSFNAPPELRTQVMENIGFPLDVQLHLHDGEIYNILEAVRTLILNWTLELEKAGILGEGMKFSQYDRQEATPVTQQFFAQNIGHIGNVSDHSSVTNQQSATITLDLNQVRNLAEQARGALPLIPPVTRQDLEPTINQIDQELAKEAPSESRLKELLRSARTICEGATGNLAAQGVVGLIAGLLGA